MQYLYDGELYKIVKITGPRHNMLALGFGENQKTIEVVDLDNSNETTANVFSSNVKNQVIVGVDEINKELGTNYIVTKIQFVGSDSASETIYIKLSKKIISMLHTGGKFTQI